MTVSADFQTAFDAWRAARMEKLTAEDGWLNLLGRWWITPGTVTIGAGAGNDIHLDTGPEQLGRLTLHDGDTATFEPAEGEAVQLDRTAGRFGWRADRFLLEITALNAVYLEAGQLNVELLGRGFAWLDTGTHDSLIQAGELIRTLELRQGLRIGCIEEVAYSKGFIDREQLADLGRAQAKGEYGQYLIRLAERLAPGAEPAE